MLAVALLVQLACTPCTPEHGYIDIDQDGYGVSPPQWTCLPHARRATDGGDCDDTDAAISPAAEERCDQIDNDCDGLVDEEAFDARTWYRDADGDGFGTPSDSRVGCEQPDHHVHSAQDCDDTNPWTHPMADELCNDIDDDCDGDIDEDTVDPEVAWYADADGDGFGDPSTREESCVRPPGRVLNGDDCDDTDATLNPSNERCGCRDGVDTDGDGLIDCEDGDCAASSLCIEADCTDSNDSDQDGAWDCFDEDCWGDSACATPLGMAWVQGGNAQAALTLETFHYRGTHIDRDRTNTHATVSISSLYGTVWFLSPAKGSTAWCEWTLSHAAWTSSFVWNRRSAHGSSTIRRTSINDGVVRSGFVLSSACPFSGSAGTLLPPRVGAGARPWGDVVTSSFSGCGMDWYLPGKRDSRVSSGRSYITRSWCGGRSYSGRRWISSTAQISLTTGDAYWAGRCR